MPIASYLVFPESGKTSQVKHDLDAIPGCETIQSENKELLILVTTSESLTADEELQKKIEAVADIHCLALVTGHDDADSAQGA